MNIIIEIERYDPLTDKVPHISSYTVTADPTDRVLDLLIDIARNQDGTLAFRRSCAHGVCGSDAMRIGGKERLACKTLVRDVVDGDGGTISIGPLRYLPVQRDLMVDHEPFFAKYRSVDPFLKPAAANPAREFVQSPQEHKMFNDATKCINCSACYSACPVLKHNPNFLGPAALVQAARFIFDSRDVGMEQRVDSVDTADGAWACENHFECTRVCPREIKVTKLINMVKRNIKKYREERGEQTAESAAMMSDQA